LALLALTGTDDHYMKILDQTLIEPSFGAQSAANYPPSLIKGPASTQLCSFREGSTCPKKATNAGRFPKNPAQNHLLAIQLLVTP